MVSKSPRGTRRFNGKVYYIAERELTKTEARMEAKRIRKAGGLARVVKQTVPGSAQLGKYSVWDRKKKAK